MHRDRLCQGSVPAGLVLTARFAVGQAVSPGSGPTAGGTSITVSGRNLGCPVQVLVGAQPASSVAATQSLLGCGSTTAVTAATPAGTLGSTVPVTVQTA